MPSPFPGIDPYLEHPDLWSEVHNRLIVAIAIALAPSLHPKYQVANVPHLNENCYIYEWFENEMKLRVPHVVFCLSFWLY